MVLPLPLQMPGGVELLVIFVMFLFPLLVLAALVGVAAYLYSRRKGHLEELEARVEELEAERGDD
ncbi:MAG: hypothetical protein ABEJ04_05430 [Halobacteriaceae archaeon]